MRSVEMTIDHLRFIKVREMERSDLGDNYIKDEGHRYLESDFKRAVLSNDGEVIFLFGGKADPCGVNAWGWMIASDLLYKNPVGSMKMIVRLHNEVKREFPRLRRLYTYNQPGFPRVFQYLKRMGYEEKWSRMFNDSIERILFVKELYHG